MRVEVREWDYWAVEYIGVFVCNVGTIHDLKF